MTDAPSKTTPSAGTCHDARHRKINLVWEMTQASIALIVVTTTCIAIFIGRVVQKTDAVPMPAEWWTICGLVVGFYFGRSNPTRPNEPRGE